VHLASETPGAETTRYSQARGWRVKAYALGRVLTVLALGGGVLAWPRPDRSHMNPEPAPRMDLEQRLDRTAAHISEFNPVWEPLALPRCGSVSPPEALLTPDPVLSGEDEDMPVRVSFIVGSDGHVHSAFVLNGAGPNEDEAVLRAVRHWRYRPAMCNGVPTDAEARVRFILR